MVGAALRLLNNPPDITTGQLPSAVPSDPQDDHYLFGDTDFAGSKHHRWLTPYDIGTIVLNGSNAVQITPGLGQGLSMMVNSDQQPDRWVISISTETAAVARISLGPGGGGPGYRIGSGQKLKLPAQGQNIITITNVSGSALTLFGTVVAVGGWDFGDIDVG